MQHNVFIVLWCNFKDLKLVDQIYIIPSNPRLNDHQTTNLTTRLNKRFANDISMLQLNEEKGVTASSFSSPLNTILERYANFEKTIGHMLAANEMEITK